MALIRFSKPEKDAITQKIQQYFSSELDQKIGTFEAGFLLEFFAEQMCSFYGIPSPTALESQMGQSGCT